MNQGEGLKAQKNILLFVGQKSRSGKDALKFIENALERRGHRIINDTREDDIDPNEVILKSQGIDAVVIGGGDGSINYALPALIETKLPLLVIPLGTANNLARSLMLPNDIEETLDLLDQGTPVDIDTGLINGIPFVNVVGLGLSTEINRLTPSSLKKWLGVVAFILTGFRLILKMNPFRATITTDEGKVVHSKSWQISICNGKHYGAGMVIKHDANHNDDKLHLLSTEVKHWWKNISIIPSVMTGHYKRDQEITLLTGCKIKIETRRKLKIDVDGDIKTETPAELAVMSKSLKVYPAMQGI